MFNYNTEGNVIELFWVLVDVSGRVTGAAVCIELPEAVEAAGRVAGKGLPLCDSLSEVQAALCRMLPFFVLYTL